MSLKENLFSNSASTSSSAVIRVFNDMRLKQGQIVSTPSLPKVYPYSKIRKIEDNLEKFLTFKVCWALVRTDV